MGKHIRFPKEILELGLIEFMEKSHFRVYAVLDYFKNKKNWKCYPSIKTICKKSQLSKSIVFKVLKDLEYWGLIRMDERPGKTTIYKIPKDLNIRIPTKKILKKIGKKRKRDKKSGKFTTYRENPSLSMEQVGERNA